MTESVLDLTARVLGIARTEREYRFLETAIAVTDLEATTRAYLAIAEDLAARGHFEVLRDVTDRFVRPSRDRLQAKLAELKAGA